ncbi:GntR family transcriptional regulator [Nisaea sp.]|jgi:DNA-binding GntR family transcriptional regulator|uniref:GntR family transcriptional regulator n=1 Tax=Nisaea sp. TaxID=2024842 RepID=UPI002B265440|nr:GntR family transcriptional regulator [Nisaea sp.]
MNESSALMVTPIAAEVSLKDKTYAALKDGIVSMNIYDPDANLRLDERQLSEQLGISRTPLREALARLAQEGLVDIQPRRGVFIVRKTKAEIIEMIKVWAALEGMAARQAAEIASDAEIQQLRRIFQETEKGRLEIDEYSSRNIEFHQAILKLGHSPLILDMTDKIFLHVRAIRVRTIGEQDRIARSMQDHMHIVEAIEARDGELAERLVKDHALALAKHVANNVNYLG